MSAEFHALSGKIKSADSKDKLARLERSCDRIFELGFLSTHEFCLLDDMIMRRYVKMEYPELS
jgi:hypothetical protein